eukprot:698968-Karenia_brevis.AAC.1
MDENADCELLLGWDACTPTICARWMTHIPDNTHKYLFWYCRTCGAEPDQQCSLTRCSSRHA